MIVEFDYYIAREMSIKDKVRCGKSSDIKTRKGEEVSIENWYLNGKNGNYMAIVIRHGEEDILDKRDFSGRVNGINGPDSEDDLVMDIDVLWAINPGDCWIVINSSGETYRGVVKSIKHTGINEESWKSYCILFDWCVNTKSGNQYYGFNAINIEFARKMNSDEKKELLKNLKVTSLFNEDGRIARIIADEQDDYFNKILEIAKGYVKEGNIENVVEEIFTLGWNARIEWDSAYE